MNTHVAKKTLVTGGRGFVGVNLVRTLMASRDVRVLDNLYRSSPTGWGEDTGNFHQVDILMPTALTPIFSGVSEVVHLAAFGSVVESVTDPRQNFSTNVQGTLNVLLAAVESGVQKLVLASTGGALIGNATPPVDEHSLPKPISPYGASKLCGEAYCHAFAASYGLQTTCLRFGNVYGPHSLHKKGAITLFIKALMEDEPIVIYGDGTASRDYIYVDDLCSGIEAALDASFSGAEVFHLASGCETSVFELADMLRKIAGKPNHPIEFRPSRSGEVARNFASYEKARNTFGFEPKQNLEDGLSLTWEWFSNLGEKAFDLEMTES